MKLVNETPFPAKLFRMTIDDNRMAGSLALRVTYEWGRNGFEPAAEQDWIVSEGQWDTPYGPMAGDLLFFRDGVDIFILGAARPPHGQSANVIDVQAELGEWRYGVRVFGNRFWQHTAFGLAPSAPAPITSIPLTLANAFGGKVKWDGLDAPFGPNPDGKGFYLDAAEAEAKPLPNIEDPACLISKWDDRPMPVGMGLCPPQFAGKYIPLIDPETHELNVSARLFNAAFPAMIAPRALPGDLLTVRGIAPMPEVKLPIPADLYEVTLSFDDEVIKRVLAIDQVGLEFDRRRMFVSYRYPFRYILYPRQQRRCVLRRKEG
jgi:hypothetical protein